MTEVASEFELTTDGRRVCSLVVDYTVYVASTFYESEDAVIQFYTGFMERYGDDIAWYSTESSGAQRPFDEKARTSVETWFRPDAQPRAQYGLYLHSGSAPADHRPPALHIFSTEGAHRANYLRFMVPPEHLTADASADAFVDLAMDVTKPFDFLSGHGGYAVYYDNRSQADKFAAGAHVAPLMMRHPGVDIGSPMNTSLKTTDAIKGVNWLTALNASFCDALGGKETIRNRLSDAVQLYDVGDGLLIRAGKHPQLGNVNRGNDLPLYREVNRVVRPLRLDNHRQIHGMSMEQTETWFERFDD